MTFEFNFKGNERGTIATWQGGSIPIPAHRGEVKECSVIRFPLRFTASLLATLFAVGSMQVVHAAGVPTITVRQEVTAAGFQFVASSDILKNAADDRTVKVFDPTVRGKTDQFILKFRKPKK